MPFLRCDSGTCVMTVTDEPVPLSSVQTPGSGGETIDSATNGRWDGSAAVEAPGPGALASCTGAEAAGSPSTAGPTAAAAGVGSAEVEEAGTPSVRGTWFAGPSPSTSSGSACGVADSTAPSGAG